MNESARGQPAGMARAGDQVILDKVLASADGKPVICRILGGFVWFVTRPPGGRQGST